MKFIYRALIIMGMLVIFSLSAFAVTKSFPDVKKGSWYEYPVNALSQLKIINGYPNGKFGPEDAVNRAQLAMVLNTYHEKVVLPMTYQIEYLHKKGRKELIGSSWEKYMKDTSYFDLKFSIGEEGLGGYDPNEEYFESVPEGWVVAYDNTVKIDNSSNEYGIKIIAREGWESGEQDLEQFYIWYSSEIGIAGVYGFFEDDVSRLVREAKAMN